MVISNFQVQKRTQITKALGQTTFLPCGKAGLEFGQSGSRVHDLHVSTIESL